MKHNTRSNPMNTIQRRQLGLTLIELMVALVISTVIAVAAISALFVSRQGFNTVDAASRLRDDSRFAVEMLQRFGVQSGFNDALDTTTRLDRDSTTGRPMVNVIPGVGGFNNAMISESDPQNSKTDRTVATQLGYGSDILILRYQIAETYPGSNIPDNSMIDCFGNPNTSPRVNPGDKSANIIFIGLEAGGEPSLRCKTDAAATDSQPIIRGVENFQVLYGVDNVTANTETIGTPTRVITNYLRADQMTVAADPLGEKTNANWRRVRSLKIGMVIRGPLGSAQTNVAQTYYPLGRAAGSAGGTVGSAMSSAADAGTIYAPPGDTRLRQVVTFTIHLRNELDPTL